MIVDPVVLGPVDQVAVKEDVLFGGLQDVPGVAGQSAQLIVEGGAHVSVVDPHEL